MTIAIQTELDPTHTGRLRHRPRRSPGHHVRGVAREDGSDQALLEAVRDGDDVAYGVLYRRHVDAVRTLARRCARRSADADDLVSDVFADTLRAIRNGRGPTDSMLPYLLRSVRHGAIDRTRWGDAAHAVPTPDEALDRPGTETLAVFDERLTNAFHDLSPRFRDVLWATVIEGATPADLAPDTQLSPGAFASLALRARRALRRSYLVHAIDRRCPSHGCAPLRRLMPSVVLGDAAAGTARRVDAHVSECASCRAALEAMRQLADEMSALSYLGWIGAVVARFTSAAGTATAALPVAVCVSLSSVVLTGATPVAPPNPTVARATFGATSDVRSHLATPTPAPIALEPDRSARTARSAASRSVRAAVGAGPLDPGAAPPSLRPVGPTSPRDAGTLQPGSADAPATPFGPSVPDGDALLAGEGPLDAVDEIVTTPATEALDDVSGTVAGATDTLVTTVDGTSDVLSTAVSDTTDGVEALLDDAVVAGTLEAAEHTVDTALDTVLDDGMGDGSAEVVEPALDATEELGADVVERVGRRLEGLTSAALDPPVPAPGG